ncbi:phosphomannose isomerase type II C-terminal cupin domain [Holophaga foetida]|uniref:phosphomannose isomerase type II C-terminal cupin domain n=1 Tax=Holophaga foetida TaxID=35839 RepID=UPI00024736F9|nr:phosphomannose isomerase type II C-terminal cupin domain [Holophaga foetida]
MLRPATSHTDKPWGGFSQYVLNTPCTVKILLCNPGQQLSLQKHAQRGELWVALDDGAVVELDGQVITPDRGAEIWIPTGATHRLSCPSSHPRPVRIMEISLGHFDENDIERLEDVYGRR